MCRFIKSTPQILLFSATFSNQVHLFANRFAPDAYEIMLKREELNVDGIKQFYMDCHDEEHKYIVLCYIYSLITVSQSIIFCKVFVKRFTACIRVINTQSHLQTKKTADKITQKMKEEGHNVNVLHGNMTSDERDLMLDDFRRGEFKVLITTNLIARGIDITQVSLVVNYDLPTAMDGNPDFDVYLHRIGRTGRFGRTGVSVIFVHNHETFRHMKALESYFGITMVRVPTEDWEETERIFKEVI